MSLRIFGPVTLSIAVAAIGTLIAAMTSGSIAVGAACGLTGILIAALMYDGAAHGTLPEDGPIAGRMMGSEPAPMHGLVDLPELGALLEVLPDPALILSSGRIARGNKAAIALFGRHVIGQDARLAIRHPAVTRHLAGGGASDAAQDVALMDLVGIGAADQSWELRIASLSPQRQLVLLTDRSARQAAEKMRVDFVANASHELRTPLAGILGFIETLNDRDAGGDVVTRERFLSIMEGEARRMQRLVDDLMSLSRIEAEKFLPPENHVDLCALAQETAAVFRSGSRPRADEIMLDLDLSCPHVRGDDAQLSQLVHNLVSNALKYGRPGTPVTVSVQRDGGDAIRLAVTDQGDGIAPEHISRLTERFYRIDSGRSRAMGGTGLGLAIVKHIVERHRGRLQIDSIVGRGTTVNVVLPAGEGGSQSS